jgi:CO/xanthine dehydrogenase Mo-binding subunit
VAAVDELTAAEAIEKIKIDLEPLPFVVDPLVSLRPGGPNAQGRTATSGSASRLRRQNRGNGPAQTPPELHTLKWTKEDFED